VINISGGEITPSGSATPLLAKAVQLCADNNVLLVAAAGNEGCECLHVPAALPLVLAVGAMNREGAPLDFSNWGPAYQAQGILAPGVGVLGAAAGGETTLAAGTSYATPLVTGVVALLLSLQRKYGRNADPQAIRDIILQTASPCDPAVALNCNRYLRGRLNLVQAFRQVRAELPARREDMAPSTASDSNGSDVTLAGETDAAQAASVVPASVVPAPAQTLPGAALERAQPTVRPSQVQPAQADTGNLVFALGTLGYDFGGDARRDWFVSVMREHGAVPEQADKLLDYFDNALRGGNRPEDRRDFAAGSVIWTLNLDATPIYAIQPAGPFADMAYIRLRQYLREQLAAESKLDATRVAAPGVLDGNVTLRSGQVVPVIVPELRGMEQVRALPDGGDDAQKKQNQSANNLQSRLFYELRNLGIAPQERALNAIATYSIQAVRTALTGHEIESVRAEKTPVARPGSDCWDVVVTTFVADKVYEAAKKVFRQTVDVSDVVPVFLGAPRIYSTM
jgi:cyanobactin maturation PatA/PatG family protease